MHKFKENLKPVYGVFSSALGGETSDKAESSLFVDMGRYNNAVAYVGASGVVSGQIITLTLLQATATDGSGSATTTKTDTFTATATNHTDVLQAEIKAEDLGTAYRYVGIRVATDDADGTEKIYGVLVAGDARYNQETLL